MVRKNIAEKKNRILKIEDEKQEERSAEDERAITLSLFGSRRQDV